MPVHKRPKECVRAVVERLVVGMRGDAVRVECDESVDGGLWRILGGNGGHFRGEGGGEEIGYQARMPCHAHGVGEVPGRVRLVQCSGRLGRPYLSSITIMSSLLPMPSCRPLLTSSFLRTSPRPSASPVARRLSVFAAQPRLVTTYHCSNIRF
jgi:hypothetical protein